MVQPPPPPPPSVILPAVPNFIPTPQPITSTSSSAPAPAPTPALEEDTLRAAVLRLDRRTQQLLDRVAPHTLYRWLSLCALLLLFVLRMYLVEGFYVVAYALFIFILNQFILFLQPKDRSSLLARAAAPGDEPLLPVADSDEFRPFVRRLPEFKFWYSTTYASLLAMFATFFKAFDIPVFWPVLLFYSIVLFVATMRRQWLDMKRLKYVPWDIGNKKVYKSDPKRVSVTRPQPHQSSAPTNVSTRLTLVPTVAVKKPSSSAPRQ